MSITIRPAKLEDVHIIAEAERAIANEPGFFCSLPAELTDANVFTTVSDSLNMGNYLVAESEGQIVGHAFLEIPQLQSLRHIADLNIAVHIGWQNKGIGTLLLTQLIQWATNSGTIEKILLNVRTTNAPAIALYKKMGFQEEGLIKNRVKVKGRYFDDLIMGLSLSRVEQKI